MGQGTAVPAGTSTLDKHSLAGLRGNTPAPLPPTPAPSKIPPCSTECGPQPGEGTDQPQPSHSTTVSSARRCLCCSWEVWVKGWVVWCRAGAPHLPKTSPATRAPGSPRCLQAASAQEHSGFGLELRSVATATCHQRRHNPSSPSCLLAQLHTLWASPWASDRQLAKPHVCIAVIWSTGAFPRYTPRPQAVTAAGIAMAQPWDTELRAPSSTLS